jgi:hypothetical protein
MENDFKKLIDLTTAQIMALPSVGTELVPAPCKGKCLVLSVVDGIVGVQVCDATNPEQN